MATYNATSPYYTTGYSQFFLDTMVNRPIPSQSVDLPFTINQTYQYRPDLLAYDVYGSAKLWWVFVQRNMSVIKDPIYDFEPGTVIFLPKKTNLQKFLGV